MGIMLYSLGVFAQTTTFSYTGSVQTYTVPTGLYAVTVDMAGAAGGNSYYGYAGGLGGRVQATLAVTPGQVLQIYVGQKGPDANVSLPGNPGGYNGGGQGSAYGGSGGGASDIRVSPYTLSDRVIVAGAGSGGAQYCVDPGAAGGGLNGSDGVLCGSYSATDCGTGGTQAAGGLGATSGGAGAGAFGIGGAAAHGGYFYYGFFGTYYRYYYYNGSGGGGGYYGGGGGQNGTGGGGSSFYGGAGVSAASTTPGYQSGDGYVILSPACIPGSPSPAIVAMTGGGGYCSGGTGVSVGLAASAVGVNYQLYLGGVAVGSPVAGVGAAFSFGLQTTAGVYTATATNSYGCTNTMSGSETVTIYPLPNIYNITGGGAYCTGSTGVAVGLDNSDAGINYQLYRGGLPLVGTTIAGTGAAISFGLQTVAGVYTVVAKNAGYTGCTQTMNGSATVTSNPLPTAYSVTGTGSYCTGSTGVDVGLANSDAGVNYQLYVGTAPVGTALAGTGSALDFGFQTTAGTYTVIATDGTTGCTKTMTGSAIVTITPLPTAYTVTGGGSYCAGGAGVAVGLSGSAAGVSYQLMLGGVPAGAPVAGTGSPISFGLQTPAGTYTVTATGATGCVNTMTGSVNVSINALPNAYAMTGGGSFCSGGTGTTVGLANSDIGVNYQLYRGGTTPVGSPVAGTGSAITFGLETIGGTYTAVATDATTGCTSSMSGSATVVVNALPAMVSMTGGGGYCTGGTGVHVGLASSAVGINYQLWMGSTSIGTAVAGTGTALDFGLQTTAGTYTATATNPVTGCTSTMTGSETVTIYSVPTAFTVTGGGAYCTGGSGVVVGLSGSALLTNYQLYVGGVAVAGASVTGTGGAISFGAQTTGGVYTVVATSTSTGCTNTMTGSVTITVNPLPIAYTVTSSSSTYCTGGTGVTIGVANSQSGVNYQLFKGTVLVSTTSGTGSAITFSAYSALAGTYSVVATDATTGCSQNMSNSVTVTTTALPAAFTVTGGGSYCTGGTGVNVGLSGSVAYVSYQLYNGTTPVGTPIVGVGASISFGLQTAAGTYTVVGTNTLTGCSNNMSGSVTVTVAPLPTAYTVTGGGGYCTSGTGVHVGLASSNTGVQYQLWRGTTGVGSPVAGTGSALDFGLQTIAGTYTVSATSVGTLCNNNMTGSVTVSVNPPPTAYAVTGGGAYCTGGTGVNVGLANSQTGVNYQLMRGTTAVGSPVAGTGSSISFGMQTIAGSYGVVATNATTGCVSSMTGTVAVSITALPTAYTVTGGGSFCSGGTGVAVGLSGSQVGVSYQLYNSTVAVGSPVAGTGSTLSFGAMTTAGTYVVTGTTTGGCANNMSGSATVAITSLPTSYTVTGGGSYCSGGTGVAVGLANSAIGVTYKLYRGTTLVGSAVAGTGSAISFGLQTTAGTYTVTGTATGGCTSNMSGSAIVSVTSVPAIVSMTGGGGYCSGGAGVHIGLAASVVGTNYQLWLGTTAVGSPVAGTGTSLDFGLETTAGTYTATAANGSCTSTMSGSKTVYVNATPTAYTVTGGGSYCTGSTGVHIGLSGSTSGVSYKLYNTGTPVATMTGTGAALDFGLITAAGTYTIVATNGTGCTTTMTGSAMVAINPNPSISGSLFTLAPGGTTTLTGSISGGTWTSSMTSVVTVGASTGLVTGIGIGTSVITYTLTTGCYGTHAFYVTATGHRDANAANVTTATDGIGTITVAPNPNHGAFVVKGSLSTTDEQEVAIQITNLLGQVVYSGKTVAHNGIINENVQLSNNIANGMYLLVIHAGADTKVVHMAIEQ